MAAKVAPTTSRSVKDKMTIIKYCGCQSEFQDERYGKFMRLHNNGNKGDKCTVCGLMK